jgi:hypothetical protein
MPITGPSSYLPTADEFIGHWGNANSMLGAAGPILLAKGVGRADLIALRDALETQRADVETARNELEGARADIETLKASLLDRLNQFNGKLRSLSPGTRWEAMLPKAYSISESMGRVIPPLDDLESLWKSYNAENPPIFLMNGYAVAAFETEADALKAAYKAYSNAETNLGLARGLRNETQDKIHEILKQYRQRIPSEFAEGSAILATLPRLSPVPGSTPDAVQLSGSYNATTQKAELAWTPPADESVTSLQLRASAGPDYDAEDETILATFPATGPHAWTGTFALATPGSAAAFRIFSITAEGNEKGSNAVTITRPT